jgi:lycopene cyclase domain-containing protein
MNFFENEYFYFFLLFITIVFPFLASFEYRIRYFQKWKKLFTGTLFMMLIFIPWDIFFSYNDIWNFNDSFTIGIDIFKLPIEEWLFFICIPFSCVFIYESLAYFFPLKNSFPYIEKITIFFSIFLLIFGCVFYDQLYTNVCFSFASFGLVILSFQDK